MDRAPSNRAMYSSVLSYLGPALGRGALPAARGAPSSRGSGSSAGGHEVAAICSSEEPPRGSAPVSLVALRPRAGRRSVGPGAGSRAGAVEVSRGGQLGGNTEHLPTRTMLLHGECRPRRHATGQYAAPRWCELWPAPCLLAPLRHREQVHGRDREPVLPSRGIYWPDCATTTGRSWGPSSAPAPTSSPGAQPWAAQS